MKKLLLFASAVALLASCSKELTEDVSAPALGKTKIVASYGINGEETRTHLENGKTYKWDSGDALGVFVKKESGDDANAVFKFESTDDFGKGVFGGDFEMLDGEKYVAYYPYALGTELSSDGTINMVIPAKQNFNHQISAKVSEGGMYAGSFTQNIAPGIGSGVAEGEDEVKLNVSFKGVASYMIFPIKGFGQIKSATLTISDVALTGEGKVDVNAKEPALKLTAEANESNQTITLNCGKGVNLDSEVSTNLWFVVPVLGNIKNNDITLTVTGEDGSKQSFTRKGFDVKDPNAAYVVGDGPNDWVFEPTGSYVIRTAEQFVEYAYAATKGVKAVTDLLGEETHDMINYGENKNNTLKPAMIVSDLTGNNAIDKIDVNVYHEAYTGKDGQFKEAVYFNWYKANGNGIETIGGEEKYSIVGNVGGEAAVIEGLNVKGNGIFFTGEDWDLNPVVKNIKFSNTKVTFPATAKSAYFVAQNTYYCDFTKVTIDGGSLVSSAEKTAIFDVVQSCSLDNKVVTIDKPVTGAALVANELDVYAGDPGKEVYNQTISEKYFTADDINFGVIVPQSKGVVVNVPTRPNALAFIKKLYKEKDTNVYPAAQGWCSVMAKDESGVLTSYWTGMLADAISNDDDIITAEEFVYAATMGTTRSEYKLTNNIDFNYTSFNARVNKNYVVNVNGAGYTILRATINTENGGLFGAKRNVTVKDLNVGPMFVNVSGKDATPYLLAESGTATNVKATNISYTFTKDATVENNIVAGLFYEGDLDVIANTNGSVELTKPATSNDNHRFDDGDFSLAQLYAKVNVNLEKPMYTVNADVENAFGLYNFYNGEKGSESSTTIYFAANRPNVYDPSGEEIILKHFWDTEKGAIDSGHTIYFRNVGENGATANTLMYNGKTVNGVTSANNLASQGKDVIFGSDLQFNVDNKINLNGGILDGNGYAFESTAKAADLKKNGTDQARAIVATEGTIKDLTITGPGRHVTSDGLNKNLTIDGCDLGQNGAYSLYLTGGNDSKVAVGVKNTSLTGWATSTYKTNYTECDFHKGSFWQKGDKNTKDEALTPETIDMWNYAITAYQPVTFSNCTFEEGMNLIVTYDRAGAFTFTFENGCKVGDKVVTEDNVYELFNVIPGANATVKLVVK